MDWENKSVLFIDDEEKSLSALQRVLIDEPCEVRLHSDPRKALEEIVARPPDVVVAGDGGRVFLEHVQELDAAIVRVMLTGTAGLHKFLRVVNDGHVYRLLLKPWNEDELRMLRNAIDYADLTTPPRARRPRARYGGLVRQGRQNSCKQPSSGCAEPRMPRCGPNEGSTRHPDPPDKYAWAFRGTQPPSPRLRSKRSTFSWSRMRSLFAGCTGPCWTRPMGWCLTGTVRRSTASRPEPRRSS